MARQQDDRPLKLSMRGNCVAGITSTFLISLEQGDAPAFVLFKAAGEGRTVNGAMCSMAGNDLWSGLNKGQI